jgi:hypothetical protein
MMVKGMSIWSIACEGFILDNLFGNEYCFYSNGPGQLKTRFRDVAVDPSETMK